MTIEEKQFLKDFFENFKGLYYRQKVAQDLLEIIIGKMPINNTVRVQIEEDNYQLTEKQLIDLENRINNI